MHLLNFVNAIFDIAKYNDVDYGVAKDMFMANIRNSVDSTLPHYDGANQIDYDALLEHIGELEESTIEFHEVVGEHYHEIVSLRASDDFDAATDLVNPD